MSPFVTVNGRSYIRESLPLMRPHIAGRFVAEFCRGLGAQSPSSAVSGHPANDEVAATAADVPGRVTIVLPGTSNLKPGHAFRYPA